MRLADDTVHKQDKSYIICIGISRFTSFLIERSQFMMEAKQMHSDFVTRTSVGFQSRSVLHVGLNKVSVKLQPSGWCICTALECDGKQQDLSDFQQQHAAITRRYFACLLINHSALKFQWPHECSHIWKRMALQLNLYFILLIIFAGTRRESERRACV